MTNYNERLDEQLNYLMEYSYKYGRCEIPSSEEPPLIIARQAKQAILRWVADEVIGEDQPDIGESSHERNILRRQLREILAEHGYKGDQR